MSCPDDQDLSPLVAIAYETLGCRCGTGLGYPGRESVEANTEEVPDELPSKMNLPLDRAVDDWEVCVVCTPEGARCDYQIGWNRLGRDHGEEMAPVCVQAARGAGRRGRK